MPHPDKAAERAIIPYKVKFSMVPQGNFHESAPLCHYGNGRFVSILGSCTFVELRKSHA